MTQLNNRRNLCNTTLEAPGTQPLAMLLYGFSWRSNCNYYYLLRVWSCMGLPHLRIPMYVCTCTYRNSMNKVGVYTCTNSTSSLTRCLYISVCRLSVVVVRCCWREPIYYSSDVFFSCAYSPEGMQHILHNDSSGIIFSCAYSPEGRTHSSQLLGRAKKRF